MGACEASTTGNVICEAWAEECEGDRNESARSVPPPAPHDGLDGAAAAVRQSLWRAIPLRLLELHGPVGLGLFTFSLWDLATVPRLARRAGRISGSHS